MLKTELEYLCSLQNRDAPKVDPSFEALNEIYSSGVYTQQGWVLASVIVRDEENLFSVQHITKQDYGDRNYGVFAGVSDVEIYTQIIIHKIY
ncbi:MAG: hypothetical protein F6J98_02455 [Moorea sp. SIO4G2]|nr:hypothetical protein [Moorena sp. SIO4G2]